MPGKLKAGEGLPTREPAKINYFNYINPESENGIDGFFNFEKIQELSDDKKFELAKILADKYPYVLTCPRFSEFGITDSNEQIEILEILVEKKLPQARIERAFKFYNLEHEDQDYILGKIKRKAQPSQGIGVKTAENEYYSNNELLDNIYAFLN